ncbi:hypothetical protein ACMYSQ_001014 [Aspergillus niger]
MRASLTRAHAASSLLLHPPPHPTSSFFLLPFCLIPLSSWLFLATTTRGLPFLPHLDSSFLSGRSFKLLTPLPPPLSSLNSRDPTAEVVSYQTISPSFTTCLSEAVYPSGLGKSSINLSGSRCECPTASAGWLLH